MKFESHRILRYAGRGLALILLGLSPAPALAAEPVICFGNEPSWSLRLSDPGKGRFSTPDEPSVDYQGSETRLEPLAEEIWRGKPTTRESGDLVAFLSHTACSDGMSDETHPITARVSLADGRAFAGCCRLVSTNDGAPSAAAPIEGPTWRLTALRGLDASALHAGEESVTARFQDGRISGFSGCNRFFGGFALDGDRVEIGQMAGSMMACPEPAMKVEHAFTRALTGTFRYTVAGKTLTLLADSEPILTFEAQPEPTLAGVTWEVTGFNNGRHAVVSPLKGTRLSIEFKDGAVTGTASCNTFRATYTAGPGSIVVGPVVATRRACLGEGVMEQESEFLAALQSATVWTFQGRMLDMHRADGERVLTASPQAD